jgi:hypothetical protein
MLAYRLPAALAAVALLSLSPAIPAPARASGLEGLHDKVRIGGLTCMKDHTHRGVGSHAVMARAQTEALHDWSTFTAWEYGPAWGHFGLAHGKTMGCEHSHGAYLCKVEATPCRR